MTQIPIHLRNKIIEGGKLYHHHFAFLLELEKNTKQFFRFQLNLMELDS